MKHYWKITTILIFKKSSFFKKTKTVQLKVCLREKTFDNIHNMETFNSRLCLTTKLKVLFDFIAYLYTVDEFLQSNFDSFSSTFFFLTFQFLWPTIVNFWLFQLIDCVFFAPVILLASHFANQLISDFLSETWSDSMWLHKWYVLHNKKSYNTVISIFQANGEQLKKKPNWFNYIPMLVISRKNVPSNVLMSSCSSGELIDTLNQWGH